MGSLQTRYILLAWEREGGCLPVWWLFIHSDISSLLSCKYTLKVEYCTVCINDISSTSSSLGTFLCYVQQFWRLTWHWSTDDGFELKWDWISGHTALIWFISLWIPKFTISEVHLTYCRLVVDLHYTLVTNWLGPRFECYHNLNMFDFGVIILNH